MFSKELVAFAAGISSAAAVYQGFNYGSGLDYNTEFATAKGLAGVNGAFASARLYTTIQEGTANTPSAAIQAAIDNDVTLLLGVWGSAGQTNVDNEIAALKSAITTYGTAFTSRVAGISVGSEDLYRISPTGIINKSGVGAEPADLVNYISQVRAAIAGTSLSGAPVGHVDTWTAWVNGSNDAVIAACDFLGMDAYPYFQNTQANGIDNAYDLFFSAYDQTVAASEGKSVWVTETGWPASGPTEGQAVPSIANAKTYWDQVACKLLGNTNTWWYTLNDAGAAPSFGVTTGGETPLYDLTCSASSSSSSSTVASSTSSSAVVASSTVAASTTATSLSSIISSASSAAASASSALSSASSAVSAASSASTASAASSPATSAASSSATSAASSASSAQSLVSVTATAIPTQGGGGSPADESSAAADSSAAAASSTNPASFSSAAASASSAASGALTVSTATITPSSASGMATSAPTVGSSSIVSIVSTGTTARSTTATASLPAYTGAASTVKSTGGLIAVLFAALAAL